MPQPNIRGFFDEATFTVTYLVSDPATKKAAIIDPVLDYEPGGGVADSRSIDAVLAAAAKEGLEVEWVLETHAHADHLSAAPVVKEATGAKIGVGAQITKVQEIFRPAFLADDIAPEGKDFDELFADGDSFPLGALTVDVIFTPGHTPACVSYKIGDNVFVGDTIFMPDYGTARADFPGGDARALYASIRRLLALPPQTRLFMCHDYKAPGRDVYLWETTVAEEREKNVQIRDGIGEEEFVASRRARDEALAAPRLLLPSIQVNIRAGRFPAPGPDGVRRLLIPVTFKGAAAPSS
ncbi:MBL fold metallo-hydrolase [Methylocystis parvus]|uniref:MBL fold metallo-hydrolase n=1 Tax=Methylocystis parvus TaxID=134 RepID=A0A6B8M0A4_9HYPH|nr:MBL fold metallo-hydrolase [Methylocystis parvus]QGM97164.1 MBL fold metallo-hydrolase [Methylocystis parvus]WBJ98932.1 MBL fold metallo-hydrolase [Methylocystis parvus OBBP]